MFGSLGGGSGGSSLGHGWAEGEKLHSKVEDWPVVVGTSRLLGCSSFGY